MTCKSESKTLIMVLPFTQEMSPRTHQGDYPSPRMWMQLTCHMLTLAPTRVIVHISLASVEPTSFFHSKSVKQKVVATSFCLTDFEWKKDVGSTEARDIQ